MLRQTRLSILFQLNSKGLSAVSLQSSVSTRWVPSSSVHPSVTRFFATTMSLKHFTTKTKPPEHDGLYRYTSGRWLIDEERQISQRFMKFDIGKLCCLAASLLEGKPTCIRVDKLEGKSNRAFLLTMDDGREVIAKLPYPAFGPKFHSTASEVATMKFLHLYTTIPVPKVLAWSSESANDVGAEYIIMEKIPGVALSELWEGLSTLERYNLIERIVAMEKELASLEFPAYGALYLRDSIPAGLKRFPLSGPLDYEELFCVGPSYHRCAWYESLETFPNNMDAGPWPALKDFAISSVQRELEAIESSKAESKHHVKILNDFQSLNEYRVLLEKASSIIPILSSDSRVRDVSKPVLWHTGLRLENVFVSTNDPTHIQGIIGWRSSQISPLFLQSSFPEFLATPSFYAFSDELPSLSGFSELGPEKQQRALKIRELAARSKYYEMCIVEYNELVYDAMKLDRKLLMPFQCCQLFSTGGLVRLRNSLICISKDWATLGLAGHCPFTFTAEELVKHEEQVAPHEDALKLMELVKDQLSTGDEGWVPAERWESTNQRNKVLFDQFTKSLSENSSHETASRKWPFPPREA